MWQIFKTLKDTIKAVRFYRQREEEGGWEEKGEERGVWEMGG